MHNLLVGGNVQMGTVVLLHAFFRILLSATSTQLSLLLLPHFSSTLSFPLYSLLSYPYPYSNPALSLPAVNEKVLDFAWVNKNEFPEYFKDESMLQLLADVFYCP
jgi:hypothetical protein